MRVVMSKEFELNGYSGSRMAGPITRAEARIAESAGAVRSVLAAAAAGVAIGAPIAPARGPQKLVVEYLIQRGGVRHVVGAHSERLDVFDAMERRARAAHDASGVQSAFVPPFTPGQVATARHYRAMVERHGAGGMRCASLEASVSGGSGGGGSFIDGFITEGQTIAQMRKRIGIGAAMVVRRVRPSLRGGRGAGVVLDATLVQMVCIDDLSLSEVLRRHGWAAKGEHREALRLALWRALDRMQGYDPGAHTK